MAAPTIAVTAPGYWQVAAGSEGEGRDYSAWFISHGIAFVGGDQQTQCILQIKAGDRIALKRGTSQLVAVGIARECNGVVAGQNDKPWLMDFDGWELPAYCYVDWHPLPQPLECKGFIQGTVSGIDKTNIRETVDHFLETLPARASYDPEPQCPAKITVEQILDFLIDNGLRPGTAEDFVQALNRIRLLVNYYWRRVQDPREVREHETRTFLIVPLLIALGWPEHQLKIELKVSGGRVDIAGFKRPFFRNSQGAYNLQDCTLLVESKGFSKGLTYAAGQGHTYASQFPNCKVVIASNGYCYKAYCRTEAGFSDRPSAYLNLLNPTEAFPLDPANVKGALEVFRLLLPSSSFD